MVVDDAGCSLPAGPVHSTRSPLAYVWYAGHTSCASSFGFTATKGNSTNRSAGRLPVHTAPMTAFAESRISSSCQPGTSPNETTRSPDGNLISTRLVATSFSFGTRRTYFSYAPCVLLFGKTTACAEAVDGARSITAKRQKILF